MFGPQGEGSAQDLTMCCMESLAERVRQQERPGWSWVIVFPPSAVPLGLPKYTAYPANILVA